MAPPDEKKQWVDALSGMSWPLLVGAAACSAFYVMVLQGPLHTPFMMRYFASHPILYFEAAMFFIALATLTIKFCELATQTAALRRIELQPSSESDPRDQSRQLLTTLDLLPSTLRHTCLADRLCNALRYVERKGSADGLDEELKNLSELDAAQQKKGYGLVRIIAGLIPLLGILGTLIGISDSLASLDYRMLATDAAAAVKSLLAGIYVAFDTTAIGIALSMILMLVMFFLDHFDTTLLAAVDERINDWMAARFPDLGGKSQGYVRAVERMSSAVIKTTETLIKQQTDQWKLAIDQTNQQLGTMAQATGEQIRAALTESLDTSLKNHAERLARFECEADQQMRARWDQWQAALAENVRVVGEQQREVIRQTDTLTKFVAAVGEIVDLENSLSKNLQTLASTRRFEDTVLSLSAAVQLMTARLSNLPDHPSPIELRATTQGRAA